MRHSVTPVSVLQLTFSLAFGTLSAAVTVSHAATPVDRREQQLGLDNGVAGQRVLEAGGPFAGAI